jgi:hypothetical protein
MPRGRGILVRVGVFSARWLSCTFGAHPASTGLEQALLLIRVATEVQLTTILLVDRLHLWYQLCLHRMGITGAVGQHAV